LKKSVFRCRVDLSIGYTIFRLFIKYSFFVPNRVIDAPIIFSRRLLRLFCRHILRYKVIKILCYAFTHFPRFIAEIILILLAQFEVKAVKLLCLVCIVCTMCFICILCISKETVYASWVFFECFFMHVNFPLSNILL